MKSPDQNGDEDAAPKKKKAKKEKEEPYVCGHVVCLTCSDTIVKPGGRCCVCEAEVDDAGRIPLGKEGTSSIIYHGNGADHYAYRYRVRCCRWRRGKKVDNRLQGLSRCYICCAVPFNVVWPFRSARQTEDTCRCTSSRSDWPGVGCILSLAKTAIVSLLQGRTVAIPLYLFIIVEYMQLHKKSPDLNTDQALVAPALRPVPRQLTSAARIHMTVKT